MSYGALSDNAILALNTAARLGGFYHNTGEGGGAFRERMDIFQKHMTLNPFDSVPLPLSARRRHCVEHRVGLLWLPRGGRQLLAGTVRGARRLPRRQDDRAQAVAGAPIRLEMFFVCFYVCDAFFGGVFQGAKPAHGGVLPGAKVTPIIAEARGVPVGVDCLSPLRHSAFSGPIGLINFIGKLRELSGGKPVGFKLCVGDPVELCEVVRAMLESGITPDFITVDGGGAASRENGILLEKHTTINPFTIFPSRGRHGRRPARVLQLRGHAPRGGADAAERRAGGRGPARRHSQCVLSFPFPFLSNVGVFSSNLGVTHVLAVIAAGKVLTGFSLVKTLALGADVCNVRLC